MIDQTIGAVVAGFILGFFFGFFGLTTGYEDDSFWTFWGIVALLAYYMVCELVWGKTIGKLITGTRVVMSDGSKPEFADIFKRTLSRIVPFEAFSFTGSNPVGWHDKWSDTRVVSD